MKNAVKSFVNSLGGTSTYSGNTKTMYVSDNTIEAVKQQFPTLSFNLDVKQPNLNLNVPNAKLRRSSKRYKTGLVG